MIMKTSRDFLRKTVTLSAGLLLQDVIIGCTFAKSPNILLVSGWQDVNMDRLSQCAGQG
jgi:hypothetical protein